MIISHATGIAALTVLFITSPPVDEGGRLGNQYPWKDPPFDWGSSKIECTTTKESGVLTCKDWRGSVVTCHLETTQLVCK